MMGKVLTRKDKKTREAIGGWRTGARLAVLGLVSNNMYGN